MKFQADFEEVEKKDAKLSKDKLKEMFGRRNVADMTISSYFSCDKHNSEQLCGKSMLLSPGSLIATVCLDLWRQALVSRWEAIAIR